MQKDKGLKEGFTMEREMLKGKIAVITGASYGMGQAMAELFPASKMGRHVKGQVIQVCNGEFL